MAMRRKRSAFSLVEAIIAMFVLTIAIFAVIEVFTASLRITAESALDTTDILLEYSNFQRAFTDETVPGAVLAGDINVIFSDGVVSRDVKLKRFELGDRKRVRIPIYRSGH